MRNAITVGVDFGSDSVRVLLVDCTTGQELETEVVYYPRWNRREFCQPSRKQFRHHPLDYIESLEIAVRNAVGRLPKGSRDRIIGIGIDATGSTPAPINEDGQVLALLPEFTDNPNAMFVLWKDHTAIEEAHEITKACKAGKFPDYTKYIGGVYSAEWFWAKALHISKRDKQVCEAAVSWVELTDWIPALLSGTTRPEHIRRGRCTSGHKCLWHPEWGGLPPQEFFSSLDPALTQSLQHPLFIDTFTADIPVGTITSEWAERLNVPRTTIISGGEFDCHMGAIGAGAEKNTLVRVIGTSTCDILMETPEQIGNKAIAGICGQVDGSSVPGFICLEAGQSAFGDMYALFARILSWPLDALAKELPEASAKIEALKEDLIPRLTEEWAASFEPERIPLVLDWINGRRTPFANQRLKGVVGDIDLASTAPELFGGFIVATAFGGRAIMECMTSQDVPVHRVRAIGGIARKSPVIMQVCADAMNRTLEVLQSKHCCALGAAIVAAVAAGQFINVEEAEKTMASPVLQNFEPNAALVPAYEKLYQKYLTWAKEVEPLYNPNIKEEACLP